MPENGAAIVSTPREKEWRLIFVRWKQSGLSSRAFCERENVSRNLFYYWKRQIRVRDEAAAKAKKPAKTKPRPVKFVPLRVTPSPGFFEVALAAGRTVRVPSTFEPKALARLIAVLEGRPC